MISPAQSFTSASALFDSGTAQLVLDRSASSQDVAHSRNRGMCLVRLARAAVHDRDLDRTVCATQESLRMIDSGMTSTRNMRQLVLVRDGLGQYQDTACARDTIELLNLRIA